jgi:hypothetical protein
LRHRRGGMTSRPLIAVCGRLLCQASELPLMPSMHYRRRWRQTRRLAISTREATSHRPTISGEPVAGSTKKAPEGGAWSTGVLARRCGMNRVADRLPSIMMSLAIRVHFHRPAISTMLIPSRYMPFYCLAINRTPGTIWPVTDLLSLLND